MYSSSLPYPDIHFASSRENTGYFQVWKECNLSPPPSCDRTGAGQSASEVLSAVMGEGSVHHLLVSSKGTTLRKKPDRSVRSRCTNYAMLVQQSTLPFYCVLTGDTPPPEHFQCSQLLAETADREPAGRPFSVMSLQQKSPSVRPASVHRGPTFSPCILGLKACSYLLWSVSDSV